MKCECDITTPHHMIRILSPSPCIQSAPKNLPQESGAPSTAVHDTAIITSNVPMFLDIV